MFKKYKLNNDEMEGVITQSDMDFSDEVVEFSSDVIVPISDNGVLDTTNPLNIAKYKSNLKVMINGAKELGYVDNFWLIREDDFFPRDLKWRVSSKDTGREFAKSRLAYELRLAKVHEKLQGERSFNTNFDVPFNEKVVSEELNKLSKANPLYGMVYEPVRFRSTKHFTINTPLAYTSSYNWVKSGRDFVLFDKINNFLNSGYGYSAHYLDGYLSVSQESLPISLDAICGIDDSKYDRIMSNIEVRDSLKKIKTIRIIGDQDLGINMILSENGVLPYRPGKYMQYDNQLITIMENSMKNLCEKNDLDYKQGHGNINGQGGHFSNLYDGMNGERDEFEKEFVEFLRNDLVEYKDIILDDFYRNPAPAIKKIGYEKIIASINKYNQLMINSMPNRLKKYDDLRSQITPDMHQMFITAIKNIRTLYHNYNHATIVSSDPELVEIIKRFFHSRDIKEQIMAADEINNRLNVLSDEDMMLGRKTI